MQDNELSRGFTLIEMLIAVAVLVVVFVGLLGMLESSSRVSKVESELADVQENVRYATYALVRVVRTAGGTNLPLAQMVGGSLNWVSLQILDNQTAAFTDDMSGSHTPFPGSDVLLVRGFFQYPVYFVDPHIDVDVSAGTVTLKATTGGSGMTQAVPATGTEITGKGLVLIGRNQYAVATITGGTASGSDMTVTFAGGGSDTWNTLNPGGSYTPPGFDVYQVGILDSYAFFVDQSYQLMRWRAGASGGVTEPVALGIGGFQVALELRVDTNGDGVPDTPQWFYTGGAGAPTDPQAVNGEPLMLRLTVLGRTSFPVPNWGEPTATFNVENMDPTTVTPSMRRSKWRTLQVQAALRDFVL